MATKYELMIAAIADYIAERNAENREILMPEETDGDYGINVETVEAWLEQSGLADDVVAVLTELKTLKVPDEALERFTTATCDWESDALVGIITDIVSMTPISQFIKYVNSQDFD